VCSGVACRSPVLAQRAASEGPRWTRAVGDRAGHPAEKQRMVAEKNAKMQSLNSRSEGQSGCSLLRARKRIPKKTLSETRKEGGSSCSVYSREDHSAPSGLTFRDPLAIFTKSKLVLPADPRCPASDSNSSSADRSSCRAEPWLRRSVNSNAASTLLQRGIASAGFHFPRPSFATSQTFS